MSNGNDHYDPWVARIEALKGLILPIITFLTMLVGLWRIETANTKATDIQAKAADLQTVAAVVARDTVNQDRKLDTLATKAAAVEFDTREIKQAAVSTNAINTKWLADKTGDQDDMAKAAQAQARVEAMSNVELKSAP